MKIPRFSLLFLFLFTTVITLWLGLGAYVYEDRLTWRELVWIPFGCLWVGFVYWIFSSASWSARIFFIGFFVGVSIESAMMDLWSSQDWIDFPPPSYVSRGNYPLTLPANRLLIATGSMDPFSFSLRSWVLGMTISGAIVGTLFYVVWRYFLQSKWTNQSRSDDR